MAQTTNLTKKIVSIVSSCIDNISNLLDPIQPNSSNDVAPTDSVEYPNIAIYSQ